MRHGKLVTNYLNIARVTTTIMGESNWDNQSAQFSDYSPLLHVTLTLLPGLIATRSKCSHVF